MHTFAWTVESREHEDKERNDAEVGAAFLGDVEGEARSEQCPRHLGEGEEQESTAAVGVDGEECRDGEDEVDGTEAEGGQEGVYC